MNFSEDELRNLIETQKYSILEVSRKHFIPYSQLYAFCRSHKIVPPKRGTSRTFKKSQEKRKSPILIDKETLEKEYKKEGASMKSVGEKIGVDAPTIFKYLKDYGIQRKLKNGKFTRKNPRTTKTLLKKLYFDDNYSTQNIANLLGYNNAMEVCREMRYYGIERRNYKEANKILYEAHPELREVHRQNFYEGKTGPKRNKPSWIEIAFANWCIENDIPFVYQYQIKPNSHRFDFHIEGTNILVEMDGVFWHSRPEDIERDCLFENEAKENGFCVIRITDKELEEFGTEIIEKKITL